MAAFDRRLLDPSREELVDVMQAAARAANLRRRVGLLNLDAALGSRCADAVAAEPEGVHRLGGAPHGVSMVGVAWWTDRLGRRHIRVVGRREDPFSEHHLHGFAGPGDAASPLCVVDAEHVFYRRRPEGPPQLLFCCDCGATGTAEELVWMGGCCGPCHDYREETGGPRTELYPAVFAGHTGGILGVAFAAGDEVLVSAGADGDVRFGDPWQRRPRTVDRIEGKRVELPVGFACNGRHAVLASFGGGIRWWDAADGRLLTHWQSRDRHYGYTCLALTADGARLAGSTFNTLEIWDTSDISRPVRLHEPGHVAGVVAFSPDGRLLATGRSRSEMLSVVDVESGTNLWQRSCPANAVAFSPDGALLAAGHGGLPVPQPLPPAANNAGEVELVDAADGRVRQQLLRGGASVRAVAFAPDGATLAAGGEDRVVRLWELPSGRYLGGLEGHVGSVQALAFSADGSLLASGGADGWVRLWRWRELPDRERP